MMGSGCAGGLLVGAFDCSAIGGAHAAWRLDAARRHSIAVRSAAAVSGQRREAHSIAARSAAPVSGQLMCCRLAGWCVRLQCHRRRAPARMRWQRAAATARRIRLPCDQQRQSVGSGCAGGLLVGAFDCSAIGGAHAAVSGQRREAHSIAVRSAAPVSGQLMCWRLAGWCVRLQCHRRRACGMVA